jgi:Mg2+ and Co2+ transporter CorA
VSDYTNKEMLEAIYEVRDRVTRIEESLKRTEKLEDKVESTFNKVIEAKDIGEEALALAKSNEKEIANIKAQSKDEITSLKTQNRWAWGLLLTAIITIAAQFFGFK